MRPNKASNSTYTLSESGTAGPTGGSTRNRTPGYVALAVVRNDGRAFTKEVETGSSDREGNMAAFAAEGLKLLGEVVGGKAGEGEVVGGWEERGPKGEEKL
jgi:nicotinamide mononucleotide (NMN) deamidase PncC